MTAGTVDALRWKYNVIKPEAVITDTQPPRKDAHGQAGGRTGDGERPREAAACGQLIAHRQPSISPSGSIRRKGGSRGGATEGGRGTAAGPVAACTVAELSCYEEGADERWFQALGQA